MQGDDVEIVLVSNDDLLAVAQSRPGLFDGYVPRVSPEHGTIELGEHGGDRYLRIEGGPGVGRIMFEPDELTRIHELGLNSYAYSMVGTNAEMASRVVSALAGEVRIVIDNDWDRILPSEEFENLSPNDRIALIQAKHGGSSST